MGLASNSQKFFGGDKNDAKLKTVVFVGREIEIPGLCGYVIESNKR